MGTDSSAQQNKQHGFSLVESAIVLAVVGLVLGGIWVASAAVYENYKVNKTVEGMQQIVANIQERLSLRDAALLPDGGDPTFYNFLITADAFPKEWMRGNVVIAPIGTVVHSWLYNSGQIGSSFNLQFFGLKQSECIKFVVQGSQLQASNNKIPFYSSWEQLQVNYPTWRTKTTPVSPEVAATACSLATENSIYFYFPLTRVN